MKSTEILDLNTGRLTEYKNFELTPENVGRLLTRLRLKEDNFKMNNEGRKAYIEECKEYYSELEEREMNTEEMPDLIANNIVYASSYHIIDGKKEVNNKFKSDVYNTIVRLFQESINQPSKQ